MPRSSAGSRRPRVLVVYKKSAYRIYVQERRHARVAALLRAGDFAVEGLKRAHSNHEQTVAEARRLLRKMGADAAFRLRSGRGSAAHFDLVVTLGGDGTLLWASHAVGKGCPVVAINSAPKDSIGFFCAATREHLADVLADALAGRMRATALTRMRVEIDGELASNRVLNDALFTHASPAATTRYAIGDHGKRELQRSSGVWVATAAGSSAAIRSAGGKLQALSSRRLQFVVREPYTHPTRPYARLRGFAEPGEQFEIQSHIRDGRMYLDGPHVVRVVGIGCRLRFSHSDEPLSLLGIQHKRAGSSRR